MEESKKPKKKKKKLGSYPYRSVVFSATLALFVMGLFGAVLIHANSLSKLIKENLELQVFLNKRVTENERTKVSKTLADKAYVYRSGSEVGVTFISKEETAKQLIEETGEDFLDILDQNPFPDAYQVRLDPGVYASADSVEQIKVEIQKISGVDEVSYDKNLVDQINNNVLKISLVLLVFALILLLVVGILVNNTIKLALFSQRFLIRSMQLVGATRSFIQKPFLVRALLYGAIAGLLSSGLVAGLLEFGYHELEDFALLRDLQLLLILCTSMVIFGAVVTFYSTFRAVRKYLNMSLDELY